MFNNAPYVSYPHPFFFQKRPPNAEILRAMFISSIM